MIQFWSTGTPILVKVRSVDLTPRLEPKGNTPSRVVAVATR